MGTAWTFLIFLPFPALIYKEVLCSSKKSYKTRKVMSTKTSGYLQFQCHFLGNELTAKRSGQSFFWNNGITPVPRVQNFIWNDTKMPTQKGFFFACCTACPPALLLNHTLKLQKQQQFLGVDRVCCDFIFVDLFSLENSLKKSPLVITSILLLYFSA